MSELRKSIVPIVAKDGNGPNVEIGGRIIYELEDGQLGESICTGWRWQQTDKVYYIKTNESDPVHYWHRLDVPMNRVWRVYDAKDEYIDQLKAQLASDKSPSQK